MGGVNLTSITFCVRKTENTRIINLEASASTMSPSSRMNTNTDRVFFSKKEKELDHKIDHQSDEKSISPLNIEYKFPPPCFQ